MSGLLDPVESLVNSIISVPATSTAKAPTKAISEAVKSTDNADSSTKSITRTASQKNPDKTKSTVTSASAESTATSSSITTIPDPSTEAPAATSTEIESPTPAPSTRTTLITLTPSSQHHTPTITASATSAAATSTATSGAVSSSSSNHIPVAGIAVASAMGSLALLTVLFLFFRYCTPIRSRYEAWQDRKKEERTYREAIDGFSVPEDKLTRDGSPKPASYGGYRFYSDQPLDASSRYAQPQQGTGLGLGNRLSLLMQHSPFQSSRPGYHDSEIGMALTSPKNRAPVSKNF